MTDEQQKKLFDIMKKRTAEIGANMNDIYCLYCEAEIVNINASIRRDGEIFCCEECEEAYCEDVENAEAELDFGEEEK